MRNDVTDGLTVTMLGAALRASWDASTSAYPDWSEARPEAGQCAVTALVIQDLLGGDLLRAMVNGESHYWNRLPDGTDVDLTRAQFSSFAPCGTDTRDREYVMSFPDTRRRYESLREKVLERL